MIADACRRLLPTPTADVYVLTPRCKLIVRDSSVYVTRVELAGASSVYVASEGERKSFSLNFSLAFLLLFLIYIVIIFVITGKRGQWNGPTSRGCET